MELLIAVAILLSMALAYSCIRAGAIADYRMEEHKKEMQSKKRNAK